VEFDEAPYDDLAPAPEHGCDTEQILLELGESWESIIALKDAGVIT
jgi:crotonobetainyl-CoA:carnitine CoA-transferase CaiB-like acyl-CoA transferase